MNENLSRLFSFVERIFVKIGGLRAPSVEKRGRGEGMRNSERGGAAARKVCEILNAAARQR
jgi:hypothetical protein